MSAAMKSHAMGRASSSMNSSSTSSASAAACAARRSTTMVVMARHNNRISELLRHQHVCAAAAAGAEAAAAAAAAAAPVEQPAAAAAAPASSSSDGSGSADGPAPTSSVWELDFCSRPLLDERGKKVWELLVTDPERTFEYSQYFPNSKINSAELRKALEGLLARPGAVVPERARFFRGQMSTIISKALNDVGVKPLPSRRCFAIMGA